MSDLNVLPKWKPHPIAELFPRMTPDERADLKKDMLDRHGRGLPPLEHAILLYQDQILDGRHRYETWLELAAEGAGDGFFASNAPPCENVSPDKHGTVAAWMRAKSLNMVHRHIPADQKAAIFFKAVGTLPELFDAILRIKADNVARQQEGRPLGAGDQRGNTGEQIGKLVGVGQTTVKLVQRLKDEAPDAFEEVAQGKKSVKKALKEVKRARPVKAPGVTEKTFRPGDTFYTVGSVSISDNDAALVKHKVKAVDGVMYISTNGLRIAMRQAFSFQDAKAQRARRIEERISAFDTAITELKKAKRREPKVTSS